MTGKFQTFKRYRLYKPSHFRHFLWDSLGIVGKVPTAEETLEKTFRWIRASFEANKDGGSSAYYNFAHGWQASYPETTGYLIPTIYDYAKWSQKNEWRKIAREAAEWLLSIQSAEGGWSGSYSKGAELRIFNTAMIVDGMVAAAVNENDSRFMDAAFRASRWILQSMDDKGLLTKNNLDSGGAYDTLSLGCLLLAVQHMSPDEQRQTLPLIRKSLDAHLELQQPNGWFDKCNFKGSIQDAALLHHFGYTLDGLLIAAEILEDEKYFSAAKLTASKLLSNFEVNVSLPAWHKSSMEPHFDRGASFTQCLTGYSQIAIVFQKIYTAGGDLRYLNAAYKINDIVAAIGNRKFGNAGLDYGIPGSFPVNGFYQTYQVVNWSAKYHAESVLRSVGACPDRKVKLS